MPELPEVETTLQGILPVVSRQTVEHIVIRERRLRWPVPASLPRVLAGQAIRQARRRAKYLLLTTDAGTLIIHLGMSGSLKIVPRDTAPKKHDHVDIQLANGNSLRFHDPRRFGCMLWTGKDPMQHKLLRDLGPEPLADDFNAAYLHNASRGRKTDVKQFIMNSHVVVGVGNIYASEALFIAGINPKIRAGTISLKRYTALADAIKTVLTAAIRQGGTTLRDFVSGEGKPGYFKQQLNVYGREGLACIKCHATVKCIRQGQRSTYYCSRCQR